MESAKQQYLNLKEGKMTQAQFMRNIRMSLPQYVTNVSSFDDTVKILRNKGILTEADIKENIGMFHDPVGYKKSELSDLDKIFTKKLQNDGTYTIYKSGEIVKTGIEGTGNANAWINAEMKKSSINEEYGMSLEDAKAEAQRESEEDGVSVHINSIGKGRYKVSYWYDSDSTVASYEDGILTNEYDEYSDEDNDEYFFDVNAEELDETDIYNIAGNPEEEEIARSARIPRRKMPDELDAILKGLDDEEDAKHVMGDKSDFELKESKMPTGKSLYDRFSEIDRLNGQEVLIGLDYEMENDPTLTKAGAAKIVIKNLKKIPNYYTNYNMSGVKGYQPEYLGGKSADPEAHQMKFVDKNNMVDKARGMKPVKGVEKAKASANKANKETNKAEDMTLMSLIASTLRGVPKMQSQGEKVKIIRIKETLTKLVKEVMMETPDLHSIASEIFKDIKDNDSDAEDRTNIIKSYNLTPEQTDVVKEKVSHMLHNYIQR